MTTQRLVNVSLSVDESHLHAYIQDAISAVTEKFQREILHVHKTISHVKDSVGGLERDVSSVRDADLPQLYESLQEMRSTSMRRGKSMRSLSPSFIQKASGSCTPVSAQESSKPKMSFSDVPHHHLMSDDDSGDNEHDDEEMKHLHELVEQLTERVATLEKKLEENEAKSAKELHTVTSTVSTAHNDYHELLSFLGLEKNATYGGLIKTGSLEDNTYLQEADALLRQAGHRMTAIEASVKTKCAVRDLDAVVFSVSDLKGYCEAAVKRLEEQRTTLGNEVQHVAERFDKKILTCVPWTDLETWKVSVNEAMRKTRDSTVDAVKTVKQLQDEVGLMKEALNAEAAALPPYPHHRRSTMGSVSPSNVSLQSSVNTPIAAGSSVNAVKGTRQAAVAATSAHLPSTQSATQSNIATAPKVDSQGDDRPAATNTSNISEASREDRSHRYVTYAEVTPSSSIKVDVVNQGLGRLQSAMGGSSRKARPQSAVTRRV